MDIRDFTLLLNVGSNTLFGCFLGLFIVGFEAFLGDLFIFWDIAWMNFILLVSLRIDGDES